MENGKIYLSYLYLLASCFLLRIFQTAKLVIIEQTSIVLGRKNQFWGDFWAKIEKKRQKTKIFQQLSSHSQFFVLPLHRFSDKESIRGVAQSG